MDVRLVVKRGAVGEFAHPEGDDQDWVAVDTDDPNWRETAKNRLARVREHLIERQT